MIVRFIESKSNNERSPRLKRFKTLPFGTLQWGSLRIDGVVKLKEKTYLSGSRVAREWEIAKAIERFEIKEIESWHVDDESKRTQLSALSSSGRVFSRHLASLRPSNLPSWALRRGAERRLE